MSFAEDYIDMVTEGVIEGGCMVNNKKRNKTSPIDYVFFLKKIYYRAQKDISIVEI